MEYYLAIKRTVLLVHVTTRMSLKKQNAECKTLYTRVYLMIPFL